MAETKAKGMEEEICSLRKSLEERTGQLQASTSNVEQVWRGALMDFVPCVCIYWFGMFEACGSDKVPLFPNSNPYLIFFVVSTSSRV